MPGRSLWRAAGDGTTTGESPVQQGCIPRAASLPLRRAGALSNSEQARFSIACAIARAGETRSPYLIVIDELLSTLDRITAQATAHAIGRLARSRPAMRLLAASAHTDLASFLEPCFIIQRGKGGVV